MGKFSTPGADVMLEATWRNQPEAFPAPEEEEELALRVTALEGAAARPVVWSAVLCEAAGLRLRAPLVVKVEEHKDEVIATYGEVELFASGTTEAEALNNLKEEIRALYLELNETTDDELGELPSRWKRALTCIVASDDE